LTLADAGADVAVNYVVRPDAAADVCNAIRGKGRRSLPICGDVSNSDQVAAMFEVIDRDWGGVDIVVNNAGIDGVSAPAWDADPDDWRQVIAVDLFGTFYGCREALKRMIPQRRGVIINMSSVHEVIPWSGFSAYAAAKAGVAMLTKTLAQEAAPHGVRVLAVGPGAIRTPINRNVWSDPAGLADLNRKIPMGRMGQPEEIAGMVAVLASDLAAYLTGRTVFIDGGMTDFADFSHGG
jgi:NAD(P)-dependent dehydrogenase (short-subunit alcohol dehydrogenase family)